MPDNTPRRPTPNQLSASPLWETGQPPGETQTPKTRRLWAAGLLAVAVFSTSSMTISLLNRGVDGPLPQRDTAAALGDPEVPDFSLPAAPLAEPRGKSGMTSGKASPAGAGKSPSATSGSGRGAAHPGSTAHASKPSGSKPPEPSSSVVWRSFRSVNYPGRYWHISGDYVKLDPVGSDSARRDATFKVVHGLADASCYSFATADGSYLRHRDFLLHDEPADGSSLFKRDATFCARPSLYPGAVMLESVNYPGRFLRHQNFQLKLDPYQYSGLYQADSAFQLVDGLV